MKVLISGGTGLVGRYLVEGLLAAGYEVAVGGRSRPAGALFGQPVGFVPLALDPDLDQREVFGGVDHFVHAAFDHPPGRYRGGEGDDPVGFTARNLNGTVALFNAARNSGVKRCVFLSSRAVYDGLPAGRALEEDADLSPTSIYGQIKLAAERALAAMTGPTFVGSSLRLTGVYGDLRPNKWDGLIADYLGGRPVVSRAGSEVHGRDVTQALRLVLEAEPAEVAGLSFNVSDIVTDTHEILSIVKAATGVAHSLPQPADKGAVAEMTTARIKSLGWRAGGRPLLEETLRSLSR